MELPKAGHECYNRQAVRTKKAYILLGLGLFLLGARVDPYPSLTRYLIWPTALGLVLQTKVLLLRHPIYVWNTKVSASMILWEVPLVSMAATLAAEASGEPIFVASEARGAQQKRD